MVGKNWTLKTETISKTIVIIAMIAIHTMALND